MIHRKIAEKVCRGTKQPWEGTTGDSDYTSDESTRIFEQGLDPAIARLLGSEAYKWLVSVMRRTSQLNGVNPSCMTSIRENITKQLRSITAQEAQRQRLHSLQPSLYISRFSLWWKLLEFLLEEYEGKNLAEVIGQVVTLTGDGHSVQAATCRTYLEQVWPTTGSDFLDFMEKLIKRPGQVCERTLLIPHLLQDAYE